MTNKNKLLRKIIRETLLESLKGIKENEELDENGEQPLYRDYIEWSEFAKYGCKILKEIDYQGNWEVALNKAAGFKETELGWCDEGIEWD